MPSAPAAPSHAAHADPRVPPRERCVVRYLIDRWAAERGDQPYVIFDGGAALDVPRTARAGDRGRRRPAAARRAGRATTCCAGCRTRPRCCSRYFALNYLGAVYVPINTAYRGGVLEHVDRELGRAGSQSCTRDLVPRLERRRARAARATGGHGHGESPSAPLPAVRLRRRCRAARQPLQPLRATDRALGHAVDHLHVRHDRPVEGRAVVLPAHVHEPGSRGLALHRRQTTASWSTCRCSTSAAWACSFAMLARGGSIVLLERFSTDTFWPLVARHGDDRGVPARRDGDVPAQGARRAAGSRPQAAQGASSCR